MNGLRQISGLEKKAANTEDRKIGYLPVLAAEEELLFGLIR